MKKIRITALLLAIAILAGTAVFTAPVAAKTENEYYVRVGLGYGDSRKCFSYLQSGSGFSVGLSADRSFTELCAISSTQIIVVPDANLQCDLDSAEKTCYLNNSGNVGAYNIVINGNCGSFVSATRAAEKAGGFVAYSNGAWSVRVGNYKTESAAKAACKSGQSVAVPLGIAVLDAQSGKTLFESDNNTLAVKASGIGYITATFNEGFSYFSYKGFFEYLSESNKLRIVNCIDIESYVKCVMSNEIGTNATVETRKAFSLLARTVPLTKKHTKLGYDVCAGSCCQVYMGNYRQSSENDAIVDSTKGQYIAYNGSPIFCLYHHSNGGGSCSSVAAWGGEEVPYLKSVFLSEPEEGEEWSLEFNRDELFDFLKSKASFSALSAGVLSIDVEATDPYGSDYVTLLSVTDTQGNTVSIENAAAIRGSLSFQSANFKIEYVYETKALTESGVRTVKSPGIVTKDGASLFDGFNESYKTADGTAIGADSVIFNGKGKGHGVGFSSVGSETLAKEGYSYKYILNFYFDGTEILSVS